MRACCVIMGWEQRRSDKVNPGTNGSLNAYPISNVEIRTSKLSASSVFPIRNSQSGIRNRFSPFPRFPDSPFPDRPAAPVVTGGSLEQS